MTASSDHTEKKRLLVKLIHRCQQIATNRSGTQTAQQLLALAAEHVTTVATGATPENDRQ